MESKLARIVKTFTFRLGLVYVGLFGLSAVVLFAFIYTFAMRYLEGQINDSIRQQYAYLLDDYHDNGSYAVEQRIKEFIASDDEGTSVYLLVNREHEKMAGNLNEWPQHVTVEAPFEKEGQWVRFYIESMRGDLSGVEIKALVVPLSRWRSLLIGQSLQSTAKIEQTIIQTFWGSLLLTLAMAFIGALVMTRSVMGRINIINRSATSIMGGHLSVRIPFTPGGDEFDELSSNLNLMLDRIENLLKSLSEFANNIAHDLRSPLNRVINRMDAGLRDMDKQNSAYELLEKNIRDLQELVATFNSILKISELEANTDFRRFEPCDIKTIIDNLFEFYEPYAAGKHVTLTNHIAMPIKVHGEKHLLTQAFANVLDNAIKFTPEGGKIDISCVVTDNFSNIVIADNGPGIPPEFRNKVFEKFFRLEQSRHTKGNGLGLSLVAAVARIHNAQVTLEDNHPGLRVRLSFPDTGPY